VTCSSHAPANPQAPAMQASINFEIRIYACRWHQCCQWL